MRPVAAAREPPPRDIVRNKYCISRFYQPIIKIDLVPGNEFTRGQRSGFVGGGDEARAQTWRAELARHRAQRASVASLDRFLPFFLSFFLRRKRKKSPKATEALRALAQRVAPYAQLEREIKFRSRQSKESMTAISLRLSFRPMSAY